MSAPSGGEPSIVERIALSCIVAVVVELTRILEYTLVGDDDDEEEEDDDHVINRGSHRTPYRSSDICACPLTFCLSWRVAHTKLDQNKLPRHRKKTPKSEE